MIIRILVIAFALVASTTAASARCIPTSDIMRPCAYEAGLFGGITSIQVTMHRDRHAAKPQRRHARVKPGHHRHAPDALTSTVSIATQLVSHPEGCPRSAFCACGAAVHVFGHAVRDLWLAANWFKYPRALPAAGMVAVRRHHVFVLEAHLSGNTWIAYDANSGGHATRIHARSILGYTIVNPHGAG